MNIRNMHLDKWYRSPQQRIAYRDRRVREASRVEYDAVGAVCSGLLDAVYYCAFPVASSVPKSISIL
jgi:hypothetical protein